jgi:hypothetical protein
MSLFPRMLSPRFLADLVFVFVSPAMAEDVTFKSASPISLVIC